MRKSTLGSEPLPTTPFEVERPVSHGGSWGPRLRARGRWAIGGHRRFLWRAVFAVEIAAGATACGDAAVYTRAPGTDGAAIVQGTGGVTAVGAGGLGAAGGGLGAEAEGGNSGRSGDGADAAGGDTGHGAAAGGQVGAEGGAGAGARPGAPSGGQVGSGGGSGVSGLGGAGASAGGAGGRIRPGGATGAGGRTPADGPRGSGGRGGINGAGGARGTAGAGGSPETAPPDGRAGAGGHAGGGTSGGGGGGGGSRGITGSGGRAGFNDPSKIGFESSSQGWYAAAGALSNVGRRTTRAYAGVASLGATLQHTGGAPVTHTLAVDSVAPSTPPGPGSVITFHVYLPANTSAIEWVQPFVQDTNLTYASTYAARSALTFGAWNTLKLTVPANAIPTLHALGIELRTSGDTFLEDDVFIDAIDW